MAGAQFYFEKVRDRQVWDFPLVNVAVAMKPTGGNIGEARLVVNAIAATPRRAEEPRGRHRRQAAQ
jgi:xanthine dehydrogenase YagS FAD-binding subunit